MGFLMYDAGGAAFRDPDAEMRRRILDSLQSADGEHPFVTLRHDSGWSLSAYHAGAVHWQNLEDNTEPPGELNDLPVNEVLRLFALLAAGEIGRLRGLPWRVDT